MKPNWILVALGAASLWYVSKAGAPGKGGSPALAYFGLGGGALVGVGLFPHQKLLGAIGGAAGIYVIGPTIGRYLYPPTPQQQLEESTPATAIP